MSSAAVALIVYACWTLVLVTSIGLLRSGVYMSGGRPSMRFDPTGNDLSAFSERLCRAHANCYENLPVFGALVAVALATDRAALVEPLATWVVIARIAQSTVHLISTRPLMIMARFGFYLIQVVLMVLMAWRLLAA